MTRHLGKIHSGPLLFGSVLPPVAKRNIDIPALPSALQHRVAKKNTNPNLYEHVF